LFCHFISPALLHSQQQQARNPQPQAKIAISQAPFHYNGRVTMSSLLQQKQQRQLQQSQHQQENTSGRASKRRRNDKPCDIPSTSYTRITNRIPSSTVFKNIPLRSSPSDRTAISPSSGNNSDNLNNTLPSSVKLLAADLWAKFHDVENEMILTPSGRSLFPTLQFQAVNLDPDAYYSFRLDFEMVSPNRFRYSKGSWVLVEPLEHGSGDAISSCDWNSIQSTDSYDTNPALLRESCIHPDRFQLGSHWMAQSISFANVKVSNKAQTSSTARETSSKRKYDELDAEFSINVSGVNGNSDLRGYSATNTNIFHLETFHKYRPRLLLTRKDTISDTTFSTTVHRFEKAEFVAISHYQNQDVIELKKAFNPHAAGFRDKVKPPSTRPSSSSTRPSSSTLQTEQIPKKRASSSTIQPEPKKRARITMRSSQTSFDEGMECHPGSDDLDGNAMGDGATTRSNDTARADSDVAMCYNSTFVPVFSEDSTRRLRSQSSDSNTIATTSLGTIIRGNEKISERTTSHQFNQQTARSVEPVHTQGHCSQSTDLQRAMPSRNRVPRFHLDPSRASVLDTNPLTLIPGFSRGDQTIYCCKPPPTTSWYQRILEDSSTTTAAPDTEPAVLVHTISPATVDDAELLLSLYHTETPPAISWHQRNLEDSSTTTSAPDTEPTVLVHTISPATVDDADLLLTLYHTATNPK
ncbi:MAG: hypothetical protein J3R72DRAFT_148260, partial [Linnemannia gamsii]